MLVPLILILLRPGTTDAAWYSDTWRFRKLITIKSSKVPSTQTNFPVLVSITDAGLKSHAQGTGNDILFTDSTGSTKLSHEIETFATGSGKLVAWVKIPSLSSTTDTKIYMYYGNPSSPSQQDAANVWDSDFKGVYHLKENPATACTGTKEVCDSTPNDNDGDANGSMNSANQTAGQINGGINFDGVDDYIDLDNPSSLQLTGSMTLSAWVKPEDQFDTNGGRIISKYNNSSDPGYTLFAADNDGTSNFRIVIGDTSNNVIQRQGSTTWQIGNWYHVTGVYNASAQTLDIYVNGVLDNGTLTGTVPSSQKNTAWDVLIGQNIGNWARFHGVIDEPRVSSTPRSADWIATEYNNQSDPASFLTVGQQAENQGAPVGWWKFDEGQGTIANNAGTCGKTCNGTLTGMASPATYNSGWTENGKFAKALAFDGTDDVVRVSNPDTTSFTDFTLSLWVKPNVKDAADGLFDMASAGQNWQMDLYDTTNIKLFMTDADALTIGDVLTVGQWTHITITRSGSSLIGYVNGIATANGSDAQSISGINKYVMAAQSNESGTQHFNGLLDDVRIYNYALSADQIKVAYNEGSAVVLGHDTSDPLNQGLVGYWTFDESGSVQMDYIQKKSGGTGTAPTSVTLDSAATAGNRLVALVWWDTVAGGVTPPSGFSEDLTNTDSGSLTRHVSLYSKTAAGGEQTLEFGGVRFMILYEIPPSVFNVSALADSASTTTSLAVGPTGQTSGANAFAVAGIVLSGTGNSKAMSDNFTIEADDTDRRWGGSKTLTSLQTVSTTFSWTNLRTSGALVGVYVPETRDLSGNEVTLTNNNTTPLNAGKFANAPTFNGSNRYFSTATVISGVKTVSFWAKPAGTTDNYIHLASGIYINSSSGTISATGFSNPKIYVNGVQSSTIAASSWQLVTITSDTAISASAFEVGRANGSYAANNSQIDDVRIYNRALSSSEVSRLYDWGPGPVGHWTLDERTGTTAFDSSGNANTGTLTGGPQWTTGKVGQAIKFDGTDDYVNISSINNFPSGSGAPWTLAAWVNPRTCSSAHMILAYGTGSEGTSPHISCDGGAFRVSTWGTSNNLIGNAASMNQWTHVVGISDGTNLRLYINGVLNAGPLAVTNNPSTTRARIGVTPETSLQFFWNGLLDDVRIYNYALTPKQITSVMNADHPAVGSPVGSAIGHWKFDEGYGTKANNSGSAGSSINGTLTGMASPATGTSGWTNHGKFGKGLSFDGVNDYVAIPNNNAINFNADENFTISLWTKLPTNQTDTADVYNSLIDKSPVSSNYPYLIRVLNQTAGNNGSVHIRRSDGTNIPTIESNARINTDTWRHILFTKNGSLLALYIDGKLDTTTTDTTTGTTTNTDELQIGQDGAAKRLRGSLDEIKIYNYALSADEIKVEYNQGKAQVLGSLSTDPDGMTGSNSAARAYCPPGDTATCNPPVAHWTFDERQGLSANDISGNNNTGTLTGGPKWTAGKLGQALQFDGVDDYINLGDTLGLTSSFSISAWVYTRDREDNRIIDKMGASGNRGWVFGDEFGAIRISISGNGTDVATLYENGAPPLNKWAHYVAVYNASAQTLDIYQDGVLDNGSLFGTVPGSINVPSSINTRIGSGEVSNTYFNGRIDDVRIYNYARTPAQIAWDYNQGKPIAHYKLDECTGATAHDSSGNNLHGAINIGGSGSQTSAGNCESADTAAAWYNGREGKYNSSLSFDGEDDYVDIPSTTQFIQTAEPFTISTWVNLDEFGPGFDGTDDWPTVLELRTNTTSPFELFLSNANTCCGDYRGINIGSSDTFSKLRASFTPSELTAKWMHIVVTYNGSGAGTDANYKMYVDGIEKSLVTVTANFSAKSQMNRIGGTGINEYEHFDGRIDDVRIYNYPLTPTQIRTVLNEGAAIRFGPQTGSP